MDKERCQRAAEEYQDMVYRVALHAAGHPQDAEDAVQEVFLRLYLEKKPFDSSEHLRRWLIRVTVNLCRDMLKSPWRRRRGTMPADLPAEPEFERAEQGELYRAVLSLPEKYRTVLDLYYYEEVTAREIGETLGLKTSAVTTRLSRGRELLKAKLTEGKGNG